MNTHAIIFLNFLGITDVNFNKTATTTVVLHNYCVDFHSSSDTNSGYSVDDTIQSLDKVERLKLLPDDSILFKRWSGLNGYLWIKWSGTANNWNVQNPAIDKDLNLGYKFDFRNTTIPHGTNADIGAFEFNK